MAKPSDEANCTRNYLSLSPLTLLEGPCFLCKTISSTRCNSCRPDVWFCCNEHETLHRDPFKVIQPSKDVNNCYPYRVAESVEMGGRHLVATRDIAAGELILRETPLIVANLHETSPVCLTCWRPVDGLYNCARCDLPMCDDACANSSPHRDLECSLFSSDSESPDTNKGAVGKDCEKKLDKGGDPKPKRRRIPIIQSELGQPHPFYECIAPLRCLLLRDSEPLKWAAIQQMMDHIEDKPRDAHWKASQHNVVRYLLELWRLKDRGFSEADVNHAIGSLEVNAFEIGQAAPGPGTPSTRGRGVFPVTALMSHGCVSNARYIMKSDSSDESGIKYSAEVRATVPIGKGEEITDHYVTALNGTMYRRTHLRDGWFFECQCLRCKDPTECRTYCSAFSCTKKDPKDENTLVTCDGVVLSSNPLDFDAGWLCEKCGAKRKWDDEDLAGIENSLAARLDDNENDIKYNIEELEKILDQYSGHILHPRHYLMIAVKRYLLYVYNHKTPQNISSGGQQVPVLSPYQILAKKARYAQDILMMYDIICPGFTKERGLTLFELFSSSFNTIKLEASSKTKGDPGEHNSDQTLGKEHEGNILLMTPENKLAIVERLSDCLSYIEEAARCLQFEPGPTSEAEKQTQLPSFEYMVKLAAERGKKEVGEFCELLKMM